MSGKVSRARMFFMCDRPLYRPGHTVRYSFWTGTGGYGKVSEPSAWSGRQGTLTISSSRGKKLLEETRKLDALGGLSGELPLAADADLGRYSVSFRIPGQLHGHGAFRVEAYRKPEYQVSLELPQEAPLLGDSFAVKVRADYYFGAPVTEGTVNLKIIRQSYCDRWYPLGAWDWLYGRGYGWLCGASPWYRGWHGWGGTVGMEHWFPFRGDRPEVVLSTQGVLGEDGRFAVTLDTSRVKELLGDRDHEYRITAEVRDASRRTVLGEGKVIVARKPFQSLVWLDRGYGKVGEPMTACLQARSLGGAPVTGKGRLTLYRVSYDGNGEPVETPERSWEADADSRGQGRQAFSASRAGQYRLSWAVTDGRGRTVEGGVLFSIVGDGYDGRDFRFNALELVPDKETYAPGDVARLLVNTELSGATVMLHIQGRNEGQPNEVQVLRMKGKSRVVEIPIRQEDKPNLHVTAYSIQNGQCHQVARSLPVPPESRILQVDVESDKKAYEPGDKGQLRLRVKDMGGKPVTGRLVVTVYDKSVDGLAGSGQIGDIREHFWEWTRPGNFHVDFLLDRFAFHNMVEPGQEGMWLQAPGYGGVRGRGGQLRSLGMTKSMAPMAAAAPRVANVAKADMQVAEAEGAAAMDEAGAAPEAVAVRTEFADTALWAADVTTDASGCATLPLALPENLTTWRIRVWSMASGTRVGEGQAEVIVSKRLLIRPQVPRFFRERDEMTVSGIVHNYSGRDAELTVSLVDSSGCLELLDAQRQRVKVGGKGGEARVDWRVKVARAGESVLRMVASDESRSLSDGVECRVPVLVHGLDILATKTGKMSGEDTVQEVVVSIPEAIAPGSCKVRIRMTSTLAGVMLDALPYLISPPDGTTDQVLSRFLPLVQTRLTLKRLGMNLSDLALKTHLARALSPQVLESLRPVYDQQALERLVRKGLDALASMQCADGGWGWFSGWGEVSTPHMTSQVVYGLLLARENGLGVPEGTLRRGLAWLKEMQTSRVKALAEHPGWRTQDVDALVYRVLCKGGERSMAMSDLLFRDRGVLSLRGLILYGLGLKETQSESTLNEILTILMQYVRRDSENGTAWLERGDDWAWWCWNYDEIETLAHFLQLLVHREPRGRLASEIAVYLVHNRRHGSYWRSTRDTAACIEAMSEYLLASGEANADIAVKLCMDGRVLTSFTTSQGAVRTGEVELVLTGADISPGHHVLRFEKTGRGVFYWGMVTSYFSYEEMIAPEGLELKVSRRVYLLTADDRMSAGADRHARAVAMRREGWKRRELRDGDRIRSGDLLEVELTVASKNDYEYLLLEDRKASGWEPVDQRSGYSWDALGAYVELRDESVKFYLRHLKRGIHALTYRVRAEQPGTFHVLPPTVRGVYAPELRGNGSEQRVIIGD